MARPIRVGYSPIESQNKAEAFFINALSYSNEITEARDRIYGANAAFCPRQNFLFSRNDWIGEEASYDAASCFYMAIGDGIERALSEGLQRQDRLIYNNLYLPDCDPDVGGKVDLVYLDDRDRIAIAEVKSTGRVPNEPKPGHWEQAMTYAAIGGFDVVNLIYVGRNVRDRNGIIIKVFELEVNEEALIGVLEKICESQIAIEEGWLPEIPLTFRQSRECGYCFFKDFCWGNDDDKPKFPTLSGEAAVDARRRASGWALELLKTREDRYLKSLNMMYRISRARELRPRLREEITKLQVGKRPFINSPISLEH